VRVSSCDLRSPQFGSLRLCKREQQAPVRRPRSKLLDAGGQGLPADFLFMHHVLATSSASFEGKVPA
jgi:hypothetical protein